MHKEFKYQSYKRIYRMTFMFIYELIILNNQLLSILNENDVEVKDCKNIRLFEDYVDMKHNNEKMTYIVAFLAEKYGMCERSVYSVISKFKRKCKIGAVE